MEEQEKIQEENKTTEKDKTQQALDEIVNENLVETNTNETIDPKSTITKDSEFNKLEKMDVNLESPETDVEKFRLDFQKVIKKGAWVSRVGLLFVFTMLIVAVVCMFMIDSSLRWISFLFIGLGIIGFIVMMVVTKRQQSAMSGDVSNYVSLVLKYVDSYVFSYNDKLENVEVAIKGKVELDDLTLAHYFDTINSFNSRNIVRFNYDKKEMKVSEVALATTYQVPFDGQDHSTDNPKKIPQASYGVFGKYINYPLVLKENTSLIILMKGVNAYLPTFTDGYVELTNLGLLDETRFKVWTTNNVVTSDILNKQEIADILNSFQPNDHLENMFLSINSHGLFVALNYNESVIEVPTQASVNGKPYITYKQDFEKILNLIDLIKE